MSKQRLTSKKPTGLTPINDRTCFVKEARIQLAGDGYAVGFGAKDVHSHECH